MKKIIMAFALCLVCAMSFSQINIQSSGNTKSKDYVFKDTQCRLACDGNIYSLYVNDIESSDVITITLGNKEEAIAGLQTLSEWFSNAEKKAYLTFTTNGGTILMYKFDNSCAYFSSGNVEFLKRYIKSSIMGAVFGAPQNRRRENDPMIGWVYSSCFTKMVKKLNGSDYDQPELVNVATAAHVYVYWNMCTQKMEQFANKLTDTTDLACRQYQGLYYTYN